MQELFRVVLGGTRDALTELPYMHFIRSTSPRPTLELFFTTLAVFPCGRTARKTAETTVFELVYHVTFMYLHVICKCKLVYLSFESSHEQTGTSKIRDFRPWAPDHPSAHCWNWRENGINQLDLTSRYQQNRNSNSNTKAASIVQALIYKPPWLQCRCQPCPQLETVKTATRAWQ